MSVEIRHPRIDEFDDFMRYVERAFGHSKGFFQAAYPHLYQPTVEAMSWAYVVAEDGEIVSHVGVYPIETVTAGVRLVVAGIGAVSTAPKARGRGYMTRLLYHAIDEMRRIGYPLSWLSGDRQRYNTFGWELAAPAYDLDFTSRSLEWYGVKPVVVEEVMPAEALETVERLLGSRTCTSIRPHLHRQIEKMDHRFFICDDGYAILSGQARQHLRISELVSASGNEAGMIRALLDWNFGDRASWRLSAWDEVRLGRLMPCAAWWRSGDSGMYRVNDLTAVLKAAAALLAERAAPLPDSAVVLQLREHDRTTATTLTIKSGQTEIRAGAHAAAVVELGPVEMARLLLGGPPTQRLPEAPAQATLAPALRALLPVPCYLPPFDYV